MKRYAVPWDLVFGLWPHIREGSRTDVDAFSRGVAERIDPPPLIEGMENLPPDPRFVLAANHYQRKGLWILHPAAVLTQIVRERYGPGNPPVRWLVTANFPRWGPLPSPGDWLLPRVAHALWCYPVAFHGSNRSFTARSVLRLLREAPRLNRPIGIFPEGAAGVAGGLGRALRGVDRLIERIGWPVAPVAISEEDRLVFRIGRAEPAGDVMSAIARTMRVPKELSRRLQT